MKSEFKVSFWFTDFEFSPEEMSKKLGVTATMSWRVGDPGVIVPNIKKRNNGWAIYSDLDKSENLAKHVETVLEKIRPFKGNFVKVSTVYPPVLSCVVYSYDGDKPSLGFEKEVVKELAELNATIDIDLYLV